MNLKKILLSVCLSLFTLAAHAEADIVRLAISSSRTTARFRT